MAYGTGDIITAIKSAKKPSALSGKQWKGALLSVLKAVIEDMKERRIEFPPDALLLDEEDEEKKEGDKEKGE